MDIKDKLNLLWKFLFLAVFTYGVMSFTCYKKSCSVSQCGKANSQLHKQCGVNCTKVCCTKPINDIDCTWIQKK